MVTTKELYRAARVLANDGQPVFPCKALGPKAKAPLTQHGVLDASTDKDQIHAWWKRFGPAAIGIATGVKWDVLDVDVKTGIDGRLHLPKLQRLGLLDGCKRVVRTPSGGYHLYFRHTPGLTNKSMRPLGLDVRAKGGYVLAPPSVIEVPGGELAAYEDLGETEGSTDDPLLWSLIAATLSPVNTHTKKPVELLPSERRASVAHLREWVSNRQPGERNNALHWAVCRCIESGIDPHELAEAASLTGLEDHEIHLTINSALRRAGLRAEDLDTEAEAMFPDA